MKYNKLYVVLSLLLILQTSCLENDLPYPQIKGIIQEIETDGFVSATINKDAQQVSILVDDTIDLRSLRITKLITSEGVQILPDSTACLDIVNFPDSSFASLDTLPASANTRINFSKSSATLTLRTYQDYPWQITAKQNITRVFKFVDAEGVSITQGTPLVDEVNKQIIVYVEQGVNLANIFIQELRLGSSIAKTIPEPTLVTDFRRPKKFEVTAFGEKETWTVSVIHATGSGLSLSPWSKRAYIMGNAKEGTNIDIKYRKKGEEYWDQVFEDEITFNEDETFTAVLRHLIPATTYEYQATIGSQVGDLSEFKTDTIPQLPNSGFENWHSYKNMDLTSPVTGLAVYGEDEEMFWDSGNWGSASIGQNITTDDESVFHGGKRAAKLASNNFVVKFAAGNIFTGKYVDTDGMDGILDFGRPFTARPMALKGWFKYTSTPISTVSSTDPIEDAQKGMNDKAHIYIALGDWDTPVKIRTKKSVRQLFDKNDSHVIAYQEMVVDQTVSNWTEFKLDLEYRSLTRQPKYIIVVCSASKYGDYFTGGEGSMLWIDDFELIYE